MRPLYAISFRFGRSRLFAIVTAWAFDWLEGNTGASTGTLTGDDEGVKFFAIYSVPVLYYGHTVPLRKKLACNWRSSNYGRVVARIRERAFWITQRVYTYVLSYVQETPTERANVSKFGHKGGANCLCILPKMIYLRKAVLLDDFAI